MKYLSGLMLLVLLAFSSPGQKAETPGPEFDIADFDKKFEIARWLVEYDQIAWKSTDLILAMDPEELKKLGPEWFCFEDENNTWHAVYGKLADGNYEPTFHFRQNDKSEIVRSLEKIDSEFLTPYATALSTANIKVSVTIDRAKSPAFNQYIRRNKDETFTVWIFPAFQRDGTAVYGGEFVFEIDKSGKEIIKNSTELQEHFRGFKTTPAREIWLNFRDVEKPTLGSIFFVWYYKEYFTKIFIDNTSTTSSLLKSGDSYTWVHVEKDQK